MYVLIYGFDTVYPYLICVLTADTLTIEVLLDQRVQCILNLLADTTRPNTRVFL